MKKYDGGYSEYIIGFTRVYYTLWCHHVNYTMGKETFSYIQNLSMSSLEEAIDKAAAIGCPHDEVDETLRGESYFERNLSARHYAPELFSFSRFAGRRMDSVTVDETYGKEVHTDYGKSHMEQKHVTGILWATYLNTDEKTIRGLRRRINARNCLVNLGLLVKIAPKMYSTPKKIEQDKVKASIIAGYHEQAGKRVTLDVKLYKESSFNTDFGTMYIQTLLDNQNRQFFYKGSTPVDIKEGEVLRIKGTVKHNEYRGEKQTLLSRIAIVEQKV